MKLLKVFFILLASALLLYMVWPTGPKDVSDFSHLPNSTRSNLPGDTWQVPNIAAYFSENYRSFVMPYYVNEYKSFTKFGIDPLRLNYPPEYAFSLIKDQTHNTYLEEITYPLRDSLFISGKNGSNCLSSAFLSLTARRAINTNPALLMNSLSFELHSAAF